MSAALNAPPPSWRMNVYEAINQVQLAMSRDGIVKGRKNEQQGYAFRGIDDMYNALSIPLASFGLCIIPRFRNRTLTERTTQKGSVLFYVTVEGEFDLVGPDGSKHTAVAFGEAMDSADKATNKAMSAAYKYMCMQLFCIPTEGDNDADATTHELKARAEAVAQRKIAELKRVPAGSEISPTQIAEVEPSYEQRHTAQVLEANAVLDESAREHVAEGPPPTLKPTRKRGSISFKALAAYKEVKDQLRAIVGDDHVYYDILKLSEVDHADALNVEQSKDVYKLLANTCIELRNDKALRDEVVGHANRIGAFAMNSAMERHSLQSVEDVLAMPDANALQAFLKELRETA